MVPYTQQENQCGDFFSMELLKHSVSQETNNKNKGKFRAFVSLSKYLLKLVSIFAGHFDKSLYLAILLVS